MNIYIDILLYFLNIFMLIIRAPRRSARRSARRTGGRRFNSIQFDSEIQCDSIQFDDAIQIVYRNIHVYASEIYKGGPTKTEIFYAPK